jgi:hypothetical protein
MTITGTISSSFLLTLGVLLGGIAWAGYFERTPPQPAAAPKVALAEPARPPLAFRQRTRFVAATGAETRPMHEATPRKASAAPPVPAKAQASRPKDKAPPAKARTRRPPAKSDDSWLSMFFGR